MSTRFILVRHGETPASIEGRFAGTTDVPLTDQGQEQVRALARRLRQVRVDAMFVSPLLRCVQTAEPITELTGRKPTLTAEIRECDFGSWENLTGTEIRDEYGDAFRSWIDDQSTAPHGGESWDDLGGRVGGWFTSASERYDGRTVLAVTHGGPIMWLSRHVAQGSSIGIFSFEIDPASVTVVQRRGPFWRIKLLNDTTHLRDPLLTATES